MNWYEAAFRKEYLALYRHRDDESAAHEARFAARALGLSAGARILDVACGNGRHARALRAEGFTVVGVDLSRDLLGEAKGTTRARADMRALPFRAAFDAATSLFTSFGYFGEGGNRAVLRAAASALRPGGGYLLDFLNAARVRATLVPASEEVHGERTYHVRRRVERGRVIKEVEITGLDQVVRYHESVRLYASGEIMRMMAEAGLLATEVYGDFDGRPHTTDAPRCIVVARRRP